MATKKLDFRTIMVTAIITSLFGLGISIINSYNTTPYAKAWIHEQGKCYERLEINSNNTIQLNVLNFGTNPGSFQACLWSDAFMDGHGKDFNQCTPFSEEVLPTTNAQLSYMLPAKFIMRAKNIEGLKISYTVNVNCKQRIWFLDRQCQGINYICNYRKVTDGRVEYYKLN